MQLFQHTSRVKEQILFYNIRLTILFPNFHENAVKKAVCRKQIICKEHTWLCHFLVIKVKWIKMESLRLFWNVCITLSCSCKSLINRWVSLKQANLGPFVQTLQKLGFRTYSNGYLTEKMGWIGYFTEKWSFASQQILTCIRRNS